GGGGAVESVCADDVESGAGCGSAAGADRGGEKILLADSGDTAGSAADPGAGYRAARADFGKFRVTDGNARGSDAGPGEQHAGSGGAADDGGGFSDFVDDSLGQ